MATEIRLLGSAVVCSSCEEPTQNCETCRAAMCHGCDAVTAVFLDSEQPEADHYICEKCAAEGSR